MEEVLPAPAMSSCSIHEGAQNRSCWVCDSASSRFSMLTWPVAAPSGLRQLQPPTASSAMHSNVAQSLCPHSLTCASTKPTSSTMTGRTSACATRPLASVRVYRTRYLHINAHSQDRPGGKCWGIAASKHHLEQSSASGTLKKEAPKQKAAHLPGKQMPCCSCEREHGRHRRPAEAVQTAVRLACTRPETSVLPVAAVVVQFVAFPAA